MIPGCPPFTRGSRAAVLEGYRVLVGCTALETRWVLPSCPTTERPPSIAVLLIVCLEAQLVRQSGGTNALTWSPPEVAPEKRLTTRRLRLAGLDGVCGLLANGHYSL